MSIINENIAYAKSILNKNGINPDSPEYQDYLKIREICGKSNGYVGILVKIRFVDQIEDMDEISSIFDILKNSKIDINKLNKLSYKKILDIFYDELVYDKDKDKDKDLELVYKDSQYSYFKVHTYKGILRIGSPSWCLKTKSNWDKYHAKYPDQWVVIDNRYLKSIITPDNNYLNNYISSKGWIRFGVSINMDTSKGVPDYIAFSDNNYDTNHNDNYTFFGVLFTILNLSQGIKKSYYQSMPGCEPVSGSAWLKVIDKKKVCNNFNLNSDYFGDKEEIYIICSKSYSMTCGFLSLSPILVNTFLPIRKIKKLNFGNIKKPTTKGILERYAMNVDYNLFSGIHLKNGKLTEEDIKSKEEYITKVGKWLVFDRNSNFYQVVNTDTDSYEVPGYTITESCFEMTNPMYFYVNKKNYSVYETHPSYSNEYALDVISYLKNMNKPTSEPETEPTPEPKKKVSGFWDFMRRK